MATTGRVIEFLLAGATNPNTGAAIASGKARFFQPGTLNSQNVFSDDACSSAVSQPYTLGSGGEAKLFTLEPIRIRIHDSTDTTLLIDTVYIQRHDQQYITHPSLNSGSETTLETALTTWTTSLGVDFKYKESSSATARNYSSWLGEVHVSVKDFGAVGDGSTNDTTAIQAAIDRVKDLGGGWVYFPKGTYRITSTLSANSASYSGVKIRGAGRGVSTIQNESGTDCVVFSLSAPTVICDISITANATTNGIAITVPGTRSIVSNVSAALHRTGISAGTGCKVVDCVIESSDNDASSVGIAVSARGRIEDCEVTSGTANGRGLSLSGSDSVARGCYVSGWSEGIYVIGSRVTVDGGYVSGSTSGVNAVGSDGRVDNLYVSGATTGIFVGSNNVTVRGCSVASCTTGISVGAISGAHVHNNRLSSNTTDLSVHLSASTLVEHSNTYTTISDSSSDTRHKEWLGKRGFAGRLRINKTTSAASSNSYTPSPQSYDAEIYEGTYSAGDWNVTINNTSTTGLVDGDKLWIVVNKLNANDAPVTFGSQYLVPSSPGATSGAYSVWELTWRASSARWVCFGPTSSVPAALAL